MLKFIGLNGYVGGSSYISLKTEGTKRPSWIGDSIWCSEDCSEVEISEHADDEFVEEFLNWFESNHRRAVRGALLRMGMNI